jgi:hypothetical protein
MLHPVHLAPVGQQATQTVVVDDDIGNAHFFDVCESLLGSVIGEGCILGNGMWIESGEIAIPANPEGPGAGNEEIPIAHIMV